MATVTSTTGLSPRAIMQAAWKHYRANYHSRRFYRDGLRWALKMAWFEAKKAARIAARPVAERLARKSEILTELDSLKFLSLRYDIGKREDALRLELRELAV